MVYLILPVSLNQYLGGNTSGNTLFKRLKEQNKTKTNKEIKDMIAKLNFFSYEHNDPEYYLISNILGLLNKKGTSIENELDDYKIKSSHKKKK